MTKFKYSLIVAAVFALLGVNAQAAVTVPDTSALIGSLETAATAVMAIAASVVGFYQLIRIFKWKKS